MVILLYLQEQRRSDSLSWYSLFTKELSRFIRTPILIACETQHDKRQLKILFDSRSIRSFHPIYSFAGIGPESKSLFRNISKSSFGKGSVFERLHRINAKILFFNLNFALCTYVHYVEQKKGVSYRYLKEFSGLVEKNGKKFSIIIK